MVKGKKQHTHTQKRSTSICEKCDHTICSLKEWYKTEFEKLGWMVLAKSKGMSEKITNYKHSLKHLEHSIEHKITHVHDADNRDDLMIMLDNVRILIKHANKDF